MNRAIAKITRGAKRDAMPLLNLPIDNAPNELVTPPSDVQIEQPSNPQSCSNNDETHLRAKLRFFFMSPCWKWHLKRQFPWKAWFQLIKIVVITTQLILFGIERQTHVVFISESNTTFHHLLVRDWNSGYETLPYPRAAGDLALYTNQDFMASINYAVHRYNNLTKISLGLFDFHDHSNAQTFNQDAEALERRVILCLNRFKTCRIDPSSNTYQLHTDIEEKCFKFNATDDFDTESYLLDNHNETINFCGLNQLTLEFAIHAIQLKNQKPFSLPDCYHFLVKLIFDNNARTGKIRQRLDSQAQFRTCNHQLINQNSGWTVIRRDLLIAYDAFTLFITIISFLLCIRSLWHGHRLCRDVRMFFAVNRPQQYPLPWMELQVFYSPWYFLMIVTDLMVITGTVIKIDILLKIVDNYDTTGLLLGVSSLFAWFSILRYLSFFRKYNLLFITIKRALPLLLRFLVCALIIYCGFMFCGWIVLGPYHTKFQSLPITCQTMFALINGDDMYTTFANLETESIYIWIFCQLYLYTFSCLFIYVISSLVIALIIDGYDTVKKYYTDGFPKSLLQRFSEEDAPPLPGSAIWQDLSTAVESRSFCLPCCFKTCSKHDQDCRLPYTNLSSSSLTNNP